MKKVNPRIPVIASFILMLSLQSLTFGALALEPTAEEKEASRAYGNGADIEPWHIGDTWLFDGDMSMDMGGGIVITGEGVMNLSVIGTEPVSVDESGDVHECYKVFFNGSFDVHGTGVTGNGTLLGFMWFRVSDLSWVRVNLTTRYNVVIYGYPMVGFTGINTVMSPPLEHLDFPLNVGEAWRAEYNASTTYTGLAPTTVPEGRYINNYTCTEHTDMVFNSQSYNVYHIVTSDSGSVLGEAYYSPDIKFYASLNMDMGGFPLTLTIVKYIPSGINAGLSVSIEPDTANFGEDVEVSVSVVGGLGVGVVKVSVPQVGTDEVSVNVIGGTGSATITAPTATDDSPTAFDEGSFGVVAKAYVTGEIYYGVTTLTVTGPDIGLETPHFGGIVAGDNVSIPLGVVNNGTGDASSFSVDFYVNSEMRGSATVDGLAKKDTTTVFFTWMPMAPGEYTLTFKANDDNAVAEAHIANNTEIAIVSVSENTPPVLNYQSPEQGVASSIFEGEDLAFEVNMIDDQGDSITYVWYVKDSLNNTLLVDQNSSETFTFTAYYTGIGSAEYSPYTIECIASDDRPVGVMASTTVTWSLIVKNVNQPPGVEHYMPGSETVTLKEGENVTFRVNVTDIDGIDTLSYSWKSNGITVKEGTNELEIATTYTDDYSAGTYTINFTATDGQYSVYREWALIVVDVNHPPEIQSINPNGTKTINEGDSITLSVSAQDMDGDALTYSWSSDKDGNLGTEPTATIDDLSPGLHTITVTVSDGKNTTEATLYLDVKPKGGGGGGNTGGGGMGAGTDMTLPIVLVVIIVIVVVIIVVVMKKAKRGGGHAEGYEDKAVDDTLHQADRVNPR